MKSLLKGQLNSVNCERSRLFQQPNTDPPADVFKLSSSQGRITKTYLFQAVISTSQMVDILTVVVLVYMSSVFFPEPKKNVDRSSTLKSSSPPSSNHKFSHQLNQLGPDVSTCCRILDRRDSNLGFGPKSWNSSKKMRWFLFHSAYIHFKKNHPQNWMFPKNEGYPHFSSILMRFSIVNHPV